MSDPRDTYPLEPEPGPPAKPAAPAREPGKPVIEAPALLEGFEEGADFTRDPEVDRAVGLPSARLAPSPVATAPPDKPDFITPGWGQPLHWSIAGVALLIGAMVATGVNAPNNAVVRVVLTVYQVLLYTGAGVVAVYLAGALVEKRVRFVESIAARMFVAVSMFALLYHLRLVIFAPRYETKAEETIVATGCYILIVAASFKLWQRMPLAYIVGCHFALWLVLELGMQLARFVAAVPVPVPKVPG